MTHTDWEALSARERDALVAEKIFGWIMNYAVAFDNDGRVLAVAKRCATGTPPRETRVDFSAPDYTTTWGGMGLVLENLRNRGWFPGVGVDPKGWEAWIFKYTPIEGSYRPPEIKVVSDTAPDAVAHAALKAVEAEHK